jgi:Cu2+-containing amine oxidase
MIKEIKCSNYKDNLKKIYIEFNNEKHFKFIKRKECIDSFKRSNPKVKDVLVPLKDGDIRLLVVAPKEEVAIIVHQFYKLEDELNKNDEIVNEIRKMPTDKAILTVLHLIMMGDRR